MLRAEKCFQQQFFKRRLGYEMCLNVQEGGRVSSHAPVTEVTPYGVYFAYKMNGIHPFVLNTTSLLAKIDVSTITSLLETNKEFVPKEMVMPMQTIVDAHHTFSVVNPRPTTALSVCGEDYGVSLDCEVGGVKRWRAWVIPSKGVARVRVTTVDSRKLAIRRAESANKLYRSVV